MSGDTVYCRDCGSEIAARAEICPECGIRQQPPDSDGTTDVNSGLAALASFIIPGSGQIYNGEIFKGLVILVAFLAFAITVIGLVVAIPLWLWGIYDAYQTAEAAGENTATDAHDVSVDEVNAAVNKALTWYAGRGGDADEINALKQRYRSTDKVADLADTDLKTLLEAIESYETYHDSTAALQQARTAFMAERE